MEGFDYANSDYIYFVTVCARHLERPFANEKLAREVIEALMYRRENGRMWLYCYCLMPDHLHGAVSPGEGWSIPKLLQEFKSYTTRLSWRYGVRGRLWQRSYYDHIARRQEDLRAICTTNLQNVVFLTRFFV